MNEFNCPRVLIGAVSSGCGKTVIASGIMAWLSRQMKVQGFKVGPDYIDPMYYYQATGRPGRNLDSWMLTPDLVRRQFIRAARKVDISIIEGVMGLFDGADENSILEENIYSGSPAEIALLLDLPIILIIDAQKMAYSAAAVLHGFHTYHPKIKISGVIYNRVGSARHAHMLQQATQKTGIPVLGCIPRIENLQIPERHLGLFTAVEREQEVQEFIENICHAINEYLDMETVRRIALQATPLLCDVKDEERKIDILSKVNIAVAHDKAFCFYYEDNLDELRAWGANILFFSPLNDSELPKDTHGIYLGGGYPELYSEKLSHNRQLLQEVAYFIKNGMPCYAECGGLMLLTKGMLDDDGNLHKFMGILPGTCRMSNKLSLGYRQVSALRDGLFIRRGEKYRGHEFHYSIWDGYDERKAAYQVIPLKEGEKHRLEGYSDKNLLASYIHLHFAQSKELGGRFIEACRR